MVGVAYIRLWLRTTANSNKDMNQQDIMLNFGSTVGAYEAYLGANYPIYLDANLFDGTGTTADKRISTSTGGSYNATGYTISNYISVSASTMYTLKTGISAHYSWYNSSKTYISGGDWTDFTRLEAPSTASYVRFDFQTADESKVRFEQVGSGVELAGVGPIQSDGLPQYHDSFKRVDGVWYKHAEIGKKIFTGEASERWDRSENTYYTDVIKDYAIANNVPFSDQFIGTANVVGAGNVPDQRIAFNNSHQYFYRFYVRFESKFPDTPLTTWLQSHPMTLYYALATPTDTEITDSDLLAQLDTIANTYQGVNNLWLIPSASAQGEMEVRYGSGYLADGSGYYWDEGAGLEPNVVENNGIDSVRPIWKVPGPATNPTLTNITTAQTITWQGTIPADQTLIVDMAAQTATIAGTNVFQFLEGDWIELAVGPNRIDFTTTADGDNGSTLEWNGVAG